ncbi:hypothetical protein ACGFNP_25570 [Nonomuraea sp. NPDC049269]|uniref:hypothetical protein n=1 Tax=Nonomuraea sp. NPDC049269 TaxID=3364349 RepID=UPI00371269C4
MADLIRDILTGIGALVLLAAAALSALAWLAWRRDQQALKTALPPLDLPALSPEQHQRLRDDLEAFEKGETP